jgi:hypothetical protein
MKEHYPKKLKNKNKKPFGGDQKLQQENQKINK